MRCGLYKRMSAAVKMLLFTQAVPFLLLSETHVVQGGGKDCDNFIGKDKKVGKVNAPFFGVNDKSVKCTNLCGFAMNKDLSLKQDPKNCKDAVLAKGNGLVMYEGSAWDQTNIPPIHQTETWCQNKYMTTECNNMSGLSEFAKCTITDCNSNYGFCTGEDLVLKQDIPDLSTLTTVGPLLSKDTTANPSCEIRLDFIQGGSGDGFVKCKLYDLTLNKKGEYNDPLIDTLSKEHKEFWQTEPTNPKLVEYDTGFNSEWNYRLEFDPSQTFRETEMQVFCSWMREEEGKWSYWRTASNHFKVINTITPLCLPSEVTITPSNTTYGIENIATVAGATSFDCAVATQTFNLNLVVTSTGTDCKIPRAVNPINLYDKGTSLDCKYADVVKDVAATTTGINEIQLKYQLGTCDQQFITECDLDIRLEGDTLNPIIVPLKIGQFCDQSSSGLSPSHVIEQSTNAFLHSNELKNLLLYDLCAPTGYNIAHVGGTLTASSWLYPSAQITTSVSEIDIDASTVGTIQLDVTPIYAVINPWNPFLTLPGTFGIAIADCGYWNTPLAPFLYEPIFGSTANIKIKGQQFTQTNTNCLPDECYVLTQNTQDCRGDVLNDPSNVIDPLHAKVISCATVNSPPLIEFEIEIPEKDEHPAGLFLRTRKTYVDDPEGGEYNQCTPMTITYDCSLYMTGSQTIQDYFFEQSMTQIPLLPNNGNTKWVQNSKADSATGQAYCAQKCYFVEQVTSLVTPIVQNSTEPIEGIQLGLDATNMGSVAGYVECETTKGLNAPVKVQTNVFNIMICSLVTSAPTTTTEIVYVPDVANPTETFDGPQFPHTSQTACGADVDTCLMVDDASACDISAPVSVGLSCTVTDQGTDFRVSITVEKGRTYTNQYAMVYKEGLTKRNFLCSPMQPIVFDCDNLMTDLGGTDKIDDIIIPQTALAINAFNPNNVINVWIMNPVPTFCQTKCQFINQDTNSEVPQITNSTIGNNTLLIDRTSVFTIETGEVRCTFNNGTEVTKTSTVFRIEVYCLPPGVPTALAPIIYVPDITPGTVTNATVTLTTNDGTCRYDGCLIVGAEADTTDKTGLSCTVDSSVQPWTTVISIDQTLVYWNQTLPDILMKVYNSTDPTQYVISAHIPIIYDCSLHLKNWLNGTETVVDYSLPIGSASEPLNPNNPSTQWVENTKPAYCGQICYFLVSPGDTLLSQISNATSLNNDSLTIDTTLEFYTSGYVECSYKNGTEPEVKAQSNIFNINITLICDLPTGVPVPNNPVTYIPAASGTDTSTEVQIAATANNCNYDACSMLSDISGTNRTDLTCTVDNTVYPWTTVISIDKSVVYHNSSNVYMKVYMSAVPTNYVISAHIPITYDCNPFMDDLTVADPINNYIMSLQAGVNAFIFTPNNVANNWITNNNPDFCPTVCKFIEDTSTNEIPQIVNNSTQPDLTLDKTASFFASGHVQCIFSNGIDTDVSRKSTTFEVTVCEQPGVPTAPAPIIYAPDMTPGTITDTSVTLTASTVTCVYDSCLIVGAEADTSDKTGLSCTVDSSVQPWTTVISIDQSLVYWNSTPTDILMKVYSFANPSQYVISAHIPITYDCNLYMNDLLVADNINNYELMYTGSPITLSFDPNNLSPKWIDNSKPNFCRNTCSFVTVDTGAFSFTDSPAGSTSLTLDISGSATINGHVACTYDNGFDPAVTKVSNSFTIIICAQALPPTPVEILYDPEAGNTGQDSRVGPVFSYVGTVCLVTDCSVVTHSGDCTNSTDVAGLSCSLTNSPPSFTTQISIQKDLIYNNLYVKIFKLGTEAHSTCTTLQKIVYKCANIVADLTTLGAVDQITDYYLNVGGPSEPFNSNNIAGWVVNPQPLFCPIVSCQFIQITPTSPLITISPSASNSQTLTIDQTNGFVETTGQVSCTHTNTGDPSEPATIRMSNVFSIQTCEQLTTPVGPIPAIAHDPVFGESTSYSQPGPSFSFLLNPCIVDSCRMVNTCGQYVDEPGLSCSFTLSGNVYNTIFNIQKDLIFDQAVYMHLFEAGSPVKNSVCSPVIPIEFSCINHLADFTDILDYLMETDVNTGLTLLPNNAAESWISNTKPNYCPTTCKFIETITMSEVPWITSTPLGSNILGINQNEGHDVKGKVVCEFTNSTDGSTISHSTNEFRIQVIVPFNFQPMLAKPADTVILIGQNMTIELEEPTDVDVNDTPWLSSVTINPPLGKEFIIFDNTTSPKTITISPLDDEIYVGEYNVSILVDDGSAMSLNSTVVFYISVQKPFVIELPDLILEENITEEGANATQEEEAAAKKEEEEAAAKKEEEEAAAKKEEEAKMMQEIKKADQAQKKSPFKKKIDFDFKPPQDDEEKKKSILKTDFVPKPVKLRITEVSRNGHCLIMFNQQLLVPQFVRNALNNTNQTDSASNSTRLLETEDEEVQKLISLDQIDVHKDVLQAFLVISDEIEEEQRTKFYQFDLIILEWTNDWIKLYLNFTHPEMISKEFQLDQLYFTIVNPWMFTSAFGTMPTSQLDRMVNPYKIPPQLPKGISEDSLKDLAQKAMGFMVGIQISLALCIKSSIKRMWQLFFFLQMVCAMTVLEVRLPANADILVDNFKTIIFFEILKPEKFLPAVGIKMSLDEILGMDKEALLMTGQDGKTPINPDDADKANSLKQLRFFLIIGCGAFAVGFVLVVLGICIKRIRNKIFGIMTSTAKGFMWNNTIKMIIMSFLPQGIVIASAFTLTYMSQNRGFDFIANACQVGLLAICPVFFARWISKNKIKLRCNDAIAAKWEELYFEVRLPYPHWYNKTDEIWLPWYRMHTVSVFWIPIFLVRRLIWCFIPLMSYRKPGLQVVVANSILLAYSMWICHIMPLEPRQSNILIFNEFFLLIITYVELYLALEPPFESAWNAGFLFMAIPVFVILVNIGYIIQEILTQKKFDKERKALQELNLPGLKRKNALKESEINDIQKGKEIKKLEEEVKEEEKKEEEKKEETKNKNKKNKIEDKSRANLMVNFKLAQDLSNAEDGRDNLYVDLRESSDEEDNKIAETQNKISHGIFGMFSTKKNEVMEKPIVKEESQESSEPESDKEQNKIAKQNESDISMNIMLEESSSDDDQPLKMNSKVNIAPPINVLDLVKSHDKKKDKKDKKNKKEKVMLSEDEDVEKKDKHKSHKSKAESKEEKRAKRKEEKRAKRKEEEKAQRKEEEKAKRKEEKRAQRKEEKRALRKEEERAQRKEEERAQRKEEERAQRKKKADSGSDTDRAKRASVYRPAPKSAKPLYVPSIIETEEGIKLYRELMPADPQHFDIYPSVFAKAKNAQVSHVALVESIESEMSTCFDQKKRDVFRKERRERRDLKEKQKDKNEILWEQIFDLRRNWTRKEIMTEFRQFWKVSEDTIEFEIFKTAHLIERIEIARKEIAKEKIAADKRRR